jgi:asparagine synthase (glutamine-hydrolysing)
VCGVFGVFQHDACVTPHAAALRASLALLEHRGPDTHGVHVAPGVAFAHARLSLLDPDSRSNQPFWDPSGRYALVYNGEIYNFRELRAGLERSGVTFHTTSDTEVALHALIRHGPKAALARFDGMFAFAFYDAQDGTLLVARDRFGMKPLYYCETDAFVAVASEVKAFRPWLPFEPEPYSISSYLLGFGGPTKGFTFYKGIKALAPGEFVTWRRGAPAAVDTFASIAEFLDGDRIQELRSQTPRQLVDRMEQLLFDSVKRQLFADAPVGAFCSGGVDSSLIVAMAAKVHNHLAIFHANIVGPWSEYQAARQISEYLKLDLNVVEVNESHFVRELPAAMRQYEHPYTYQPNAVPFMMVSRLVAAHGVKAALSGEGSDELFLGYPWLGRKRVIDAYHAFGHRVRRMVQRVPAVGRIIWPDPGNGSQPVQTLLNRGEIAVDERRIRDAAASIAPRTLDRHQLTSLSYLNYHLRTLLHRNDCLGMEASIESRFPFLDHAVARTAINLPSRYKLRVAPTVFEKAHPFGRDKWIVREVAARWLPRALSQRIKIGFWTTIFQRMDIGPAYFERSPVLDLFEISAADLTGVVQTADQDLRMRLLHLDVWARVCLEERDVEETAERLVQHVAIRPE